MDQVLQGVSIDGVINRVVERGSDCSHVSQEFGGLDGDRVRHVDDVLIAHLERGREELATGISEIDVVDYRDNGPLELGTVDAHRFRNLASLTTIDEDRGWIG